MGSPAHCHTKGIKHCTPKTRTRFLASVAALLMAGGLTAATAATASAGTPTPTPTATVAPSPFGALHLRPEAWIIHSSTAEPAGDVVARGPVRGTGTGNFAPGVNVLTLTGPAGSVRLLKTPLGPLVVNWGTCTASLHQTGRWVLLGRTGADRRAFGFGTYTADVQAILARGLFGRCLGLRVRPVDVDTHVIGTGRAAILRFGLLAPRLTPALTPVS